FSSASLPAAWNSTPAQEQPSTFVSRDALEKAAGIPAVSSRAYGIAAHWRHAADDVLEQARRLRQNSRGSQKCRRVERLDFLSRSPEQALPLSARLRGPLAFENSGACGIECGNAGGRFAGQSSRRVSVAFRKIGILSIGEMGFHWAKLLKSRGVDVLTYDRDRGEVSRQRGANAGVASVASMAELVTQAELIVSIVVPSAATAVAAKGAGAVTTAGRKDLLFLDANAISPMTAEEIARILRPAGVEFVDGCIIGAAARMGKGTIVYVSGPAAERLRALDEFAIPTRVLGASTNQASAFKVVYAGLTKGLQGLFCELLMGARRFGLVDEIRAQYEESFPGLLDKVAGSIV